MGFAWGKFSPKQLRAIRQSTGRLNILEGAVRSGKTIASMVRWLEYLETGPSGDLLMVGKTERTLKRNVLDPISEIVGACRFRYRMGAGEIQLCGRRLYVAGANDERSETKIRGLTLAGAYGDELSVWPESFFKMLLSRLSVAGAKLLGTTNPDSPYHWLHVDYLERAPELGLRRFTFRLEDNLTLDPDYVAALKREYVGLWYQRFILGRWVLAEGVVYDGWNEDVHVVRDQDLPRRFDRYWIGVDYGTGNPTVFLLFGQHQDTLYQLSEYYWDGVKQARQKTDAEYSKDFREWLPPQVVPASIEIDPSAASFILQLRRDGVRNVREADNEVLDGIRRVAARLGNKKLRIHKRCVHTRREYGSYVWDPKAQLQGEDRPMKKHDHCMDATRYVINRVDGKMPAKTFRDRPKGW